ncbi:MAG: hypothetical protein ACFCUU_02265 [Cyclobacteriaceae bacterium]
MKPNKFQIIIFLWVIPAILFAQEEIPVGTWRTHFSYFNASIVESGDHKIMCAAENGLFFVDLKDNSINILSRIQGMSDAGVSAIKYDTKTNNWIIGYSNGNIDFVQNNRIQNLPAIKNSPTIDEKEIRQISIYADMAYLSTPFGVVVIDMRTRSIRESYRQIGIDGDEIDAYDLEIYRDSLFVATASGIFTAPLNASINLQDYNNWNRFTSDTGLPAEQFVQVEAFDDKLFAASSQGLIYTYDGTWKSEIPSMGDEVFAMQSKEGQFLLTTNTGLYQWQDDGFVKSEVSLNSPQMATINNGQLWVADGVKGLLQISDKNTVRRTPQGPLSDQISGFFTQYGRIFTMFGKIDDEGLPGNNIDGWSLHELGTWTNFSSHTFADREIPPFTGVRAMTFDPISGSYYVASINSGIMVIDRDGNYSFVNDNSLGSTLLRSQQYGDSVIISDMASALNGAVIVANYGVNRPLHFWNGADEWFADVFTGTANNYPSQILTLPSGDIWMALHPIGGGGITVSNPTTGSRRLLNTTRGNGGLPGTNVTSMAYDLTGYVWVGTDRGIAFYDVPTQILRTSNEGTFFEMNSIIPIFDSGLLLREEFITSVAVDPGNQKWIGTRNGLWLFDANVQKMVYHFTTENSPLPSNIIQDIAIDERNGEVFISTDKGLISFRGKATRPEHTHNNVKIFPNPINPSKDPEVSISGLVNNAFIKITDVNGNLVWESRSLGGTATWTIADFQGRKASSGIYLVFSSDDLGTETYIGKIAVIN